MDRALLQKLSMVNVLQPNDLLIVGGQPAEEDFSVFKALGISDVVNLRPVSEVISYDEALLAKAFSMDYHVIPVTEIDSFDMLSAQRLKRILDKRQPTVVHCASGNRVGALISLMAFWLEGVSAAEAYKAGINAGMTKLKPEVQQVLGIA